MAARTTACFRSTIGIGARLRTTRILAEWIATVQRRSYDDLNSELRNDSRDKFVNTRKADERGHLVLLLEAVVTWDDGNFESLKLLQFFIYIFVFLAFDTFHVQYIEAKKVMI
jgi:hypothetical protein